MSFDAVNAVMDMDVGDGMAKAVLLQLARHANKKGKCWPSVGRLAELANINRKTVYEALKKLIRWGLLERDPVPGERSRYTLHLEVGKRCACLDDDPVPDQGFTRPGSGTTPRPGSGTTPVPNQGRPQPESGTRISQESVIESHEAAPAPKPAPSGNATREQWAARLAAYDPSNPRTWSGTWGPTPDNQWQANHGLARHPDLLQRWRAEQSAANGRGMATA